MKRIVQAIRARLASRAAARAAQVARDDFVARLELATMSAGDVAFLVAPQGTTNTAFRHFADYLRHAVKKIRAANGRQDNGAVVLCPPGFEVAVVRDHAKAVLDSIMAAQRGELGHVLLRAAPFGGDIDGPDGVTDVSDLLLGCSPEWLQLRQALGALFLAARELGVAVTIENKALQPLAMGNHEHVVSVRELRHRGEVPA